MDATDPGPDSAGALPAGDFTEWLASFDAALGGQQSADVPCGTCTGCCTSSQFIHIGPEEQATLRRIPPALLFPAPRLPRGHMLLGYDRRGHCPMLVDGACTIYADRPQTCRTYDCRVFPAAGIQPDEPAAGAIAERAVRWSFSYSTSDGARQHGSVRAAAAFLRTYSAELPDGIAPVTSTQRAVLAVGLRGLFAGDAEPAVAEVAVEISRRRSAPGS